MVKPFNTRTRLCPARAWPRGKTDSPSLFDITFKCRYHGLTGAAIGPGAVDGKTPSPTFLFMPTTSYVKEIPLLSFRSSQWSRSKALVPWSRTGLLSLSRQEADSRKTFLGWEEEGIDLLFYTRILALLINRHRERERETLYDKEMNGDKENETSFSISKMAVRAREPLIRNNAWPQCFGTDSRHVQIVAKYKYKVWYYTSNQPNRL